MLQRSSETQLIWNNKLLLNLTKNRPIELWNWYQPNSEKLMSILATFDKVSSISSPMKWSFGSSIYHVVREGDPSWNDHEWPRGGKGRFPEWPRGHIDRYVFCVWSANGYDTWNSPFEWNDWFLKLHFDIIKNVKYSYSWPNLECAMTPRGFLVGRGFESTKFNHLCDNFSIPNKNWNYQKKISYILWGWKLFKVLIFETTRIKSHL